MRSDQAICCHVNLRPKVRTELEAFMTNRVCVTQSLEGAGAFPAPFPNWDAIASS
jgi:hypothetical protein